MFSRPLFQSIPNDPPAMRAGKLAAAAMVCALLAACSGDKAPAEGGAPQPDKFAAPTVTQKGAPDVNTVPTTVPQPKSSADERIKSLAGLVADRANAQHADQGARSLPVTVRPLSSEAPPPPAPPPKPAAAKAPAVERLAVPAPARPEEAAAEKPGTEKAPSPAPSPVASAVGPGPTRGASVSGPRQAPALPQTNDPSGEGRGTIYASVSGFRPLSSFNASAFHTSIQLATLDLASGNLSAADRSALSGAALKQTDQQGVIRIIAHGNGSLRSAQEKAATAARELERLGVPADRLFVGADGGNGSTEVFLHY